MDWEAFIEDMLSTIMDCIESCMSTISSVSGRRMLETFYVCLMFLVVSVFTRIVEIPMFITWQEVVPAVVITGYLAFMETINKCIAKGIKKSLTAVKKKRRAK